MDDPQPNNAEPSNPYERHPEPNDPPQGYPPPAYPQQNDPPQGYPPPNFPPQGYPQQSSFAPPAHPPQSAPPMTTMSPYGGLVAPPTAPVRESWLEPGDLRAAATLAGVLVVLGLVAGLLWAAVSPHGSGVVVTKTEIIPFEQENWIAADGRFALITAVIGLMAGLAAWFWKSRRGPVLAAGLAVGAVVGSLLTALVGKVVSSGHSTGAINSGIRLHIALHAHGLVAIEGVLALAAYLGGALFAGPDDLGRPVDASVTDPPPSRPPGLPVPTPGYGR